MLTRLNEYVTVRLILIKGSAGVAFRQQIERKGFSNEMRPRDFPLASGHGLLIDFWITAVGNPRVRYANQRRDLPNTIVPFRLVSLERVSLYVADKRMDQDQARTFAHAAQDGITRRSCHARPSVEARNQDQLDGRINVKVLH